MITRQRVLIAASMALLGGFAGVPQDSLAQNKVNGKAVYNHWCSHCHAAGRGHPGTQGLVIKYGESGLPAVLEERNDLTPELIKTSVRQGVLSMAPFRKTEVTDAELEDIAAYLSKQE